MVIDQNGQNLGQMATSQALLLAQEAGLDLVVISRHSDLPVAKILNFGKYLYDKKQKVKLAKKHHLVVKVKSIKVKTQISNHDLGWKSQQAIAWLQDGFRVHFVIKAFGRISTKLDLIHDTFQRFAKLVSDYGVAQGNLKKMSPTLYEVFFNPNKGPNLAGKGRKEVDHEN